MWLLVSVTSQEKRYPIVGDKKYAIGRLNCDIIINDPSVSRKQAVVFMTHHESNVVKSFIIPTLHLEDTSKFGTFVNGKRVRSYEDQVASLKDGDEIQFGGSPASKFKAVYEPFLATTSCLEKAPKKSLQKVMCLLGGHVVRDWRNSCDLLIMSKINVTIKVICAINNQKRIVTPDYLEDFYTHLLGEREKPDPANYLPEVVDREVPPGVSFHPDSRRITLLTDLKFYFLSALQFNKTNMAVSTAGGLPILLEDGTDEDAETMTEDGTIVLSVTKEVLATLSSTCQKFVRSVCSALKKKNLRMITDPEIGWAILTCNTDDFCNPKSEITPSMYSLTATQTLSIMADSGVAHLPRPDDSYKDTVNKPIKRPYTLLKVDAKSGEPVITKSNVEPETLSKVVTCTYASFLQSIPPPGPSCGKSNSPASSEEDPFQSPAKASTPQVVIRDDKNCVVINDAASVDEGDDDNNGKALANGQGHGQSRATAQSDKTVQERPDLTSNAKPREGKPSPTHYPPETRSSPRSKLANGVADAEDDRRHSKQESTSFLLDDSDDEPPARNAKTPPRKKKITSLFSDSDESPPKAQKRRKNVSLFERDEDEDCVAKAEKCRNRKEDPVTNLTESVDAADDNSVDVKDVKMFPLTNVKVEEHSAEDRDEATGEIGSTAVNAWFSGKGEVKTEKTEICQPVKEEEETEAFFDEEGHRVQNFCVVKVTDLISRPAHSQAKKKTTSSRQQDNVKNFKKFKKTQHTGSGQLPKIIGGSDLQPYIGSKLQAMDDLLSEERINDKRQDKRKKKNELFGWDDDDQD